MEPITVSSILLLPGILAFFGLFVYGVGFGNGMREHVLPKYRWAGVALLVVAALLGAKTVYLMYEPGIGMFYRAQLVGKKVIAAHYIALLLPLVLILAAFGMDAWFKRHRLNME